MATHYEHDDSVCEDARLEAAHDQPGHDVDCDCARCEAAYERALEEQDDLDEPDEPWLIPCSVCGGDAKPLGTLGEVAWFRCVDCGIDFRRGSAR